MTDASKNAYNADDRKKIDLLATKGVTLATQACAGIPINDTTVALMDVLGRVEDAFSCSMWCDDDGSDNLFYRFSNVNDGKP